jgi:hypothetical protein
MKFESISKFRLNNEDCPKDLVFLIDNFLSTLSDLEIEFNDKEGWEPWSDKSYLTEKDLADPDISANIKAIDDTFALISFVAGFPDGEYVGYWRGPENLAIENSPLVHYSNDGQFSLCGSDFIESLFFYVYDDETLDEIKRSAIASGIEMDFESIDDIEIKETEITPNEYHEKRYYQYKG